MLCWRALQESGLPLSQYSHHLFSLWGFKVSSAWSPNHPQAAHERPNQIWTICTSSPYHRIHFIQSQWSVCVSEREMRDERDESLNQDLALVNSKKTCSSLLGYQNRPIKREPHMQIQARDCAFPEKQMRHLQLCLYIFLTSDFLRSCQ